MNAETRREAELFTVRQAEGHQIPLPGPCRIRPPIGSSHAPCPERERRPVRALRDHGLSPIPFSIVHKSRVFLARKHPTFTPCAEVKLQPDSIVAPVLDQNHHPQRPPN